MKIAIMMRAMDQDSGFYLYVDGLVEALLKLEIPDVSFLLLYRTSKYFGRFSSYRNVTEILLKAPHKFVWDQVVVPYAAWKHGADIIFNPKFTVPLISHCPVSMGLQEPAWFVCPEYYEKFDVFYQKRMLRASVRKSSHFFAMAQWVIDENRKYIDFPLDSATVTFPGVHQNHKPVTDQKVLEDFRKKYNLPDKFILSMTRVDNPGMDRSNKWNPSQNPLTILKSFMLCRDKIPHHLVMAGRKVRDYFLDSGFAEKDFDKVHFVNFIPFDEIQNLYSLADFIVIAASYESFSFTLLGAMACGCPAVVATTGAFPEVVGEGALQADPFLPEDFADKIITLASDAELRNKLKRKSLAQAAKYTWENTAKLTLRGIYQAIESRHHLAGNSKRRFNNMLIQWTLGSTIEAMFSASASFFG